MFTNNKAAPSITAPTMLSIQAAQAILTGIPTVLIGLSCNIVDLEQNSYGFITRADYEKLRNKKGFSTHKMADSSTIVVHENNEKLVKKFGKRKETELPEGAVVFPEENFVIMTARGDTKKERAKYLSRIITGYSDIDAYDDAFMVVESKKALNDDFYIAPIVNVSLASPKLQWAISPNSTKLKYAWIFDNLDEAIVKLHSLVDSEPKAA